MSGGPVIGENLRDARESQKLDAFLKWFKALPGASYSSAIQLVDLSAQGRGWGIVATEDIPADANLFAIPRKAVLSVENSEVARKIPRILGRSRRAVDVVSGSEDDEDLDDLPDPWLELIIVLIYEYLHRASSKWQPYLDVLPAQLETLMYWDSVELRELQSSAILEKVGKEEAEHTFHEKLIPVIEENSEIFYPHGVEKLNRLELVRLAHRMGGIIMAYAFDLEKEDAEDGDDEDGWVQDHSELMSLGLVPMADMLNADAEFNVREPQNPQRPTLAHLIQAHLNHEEDVLTMTSLRPIKAGEEILNYYGPLPNSELLRRYGYTSARHSLYDVVEVPWKLIHEAICEHFGKPIALPDDAEVDESFVLERETDGPDETGVNNGSASFTQFPEELEEQVVPILAPSLEIEIGNRELRAAEQQLLGQTFIQVMRRALDTRIMQYPTSIAIDQELLRDMDVTSRNREAIVVRLGEKLLLQEAIDFADNALANAQFSQGKDISAEPVSKKRRVEN